MLEMFLGVLQVLPQALAYGIKLAVDLKKCRLGGQNCFGSSIPEKLLKIVNDEINKETYETDWRV
jgi:hypothetical protein